MNSPPSRHAGMVARVVGRYATPGNFSAGAKSSEPFAVKHALFHRVCLGLASSRAANSNRPARRMHQAKLVGVARAGDVVTEPRLFVREFVQPLRERLEIHEIHLNSHIMR